MSIGALLLLAAALQGATGETPSQGHRPRLALALSGGGARGIAHVGVLRALEDNGLRPDAIAGTSVGAVMGALYATGIDGERLEGIVSSFDWESLFSGRPERRLVPVTQRLDDLPALFSLGFEDWKVRLPSAALADYRINRFLTSHLAGPGFRAENDFDRLPISFRAVAAALDNGERVVLDHGDLARAVRASMSLPVLLVPVEWDGRLLVDGGVADNLSVGVARALGGDVVLAVDVSSPPLEPSQYQSLTGVASQLTDALADAQNRNYDEPADFEIRPELGRHRALDYTNIAFLIQQGYEAGLKIVAPLKQRLGLPASATAEAPRTPEGRELRGAPIVSVAVEGHQRFSELLIRRTFNIPTGVPFQMDKGLNALDKVFATGFFESCWMRFEPQGEGVRVILGVKERPRSALDFAAGYHSADKARGMIRFRNQNVFGLGERLELLWSGSDKTRLLRGSLEGERIPLTPVGYSLRLERNQDQPRVYADGVLVDRADFRHDTLRAALTKTWERTQSFEAGLAFGRVRTEAQPSLAFETDQDQVGLAFGRFVWDKLDDLRLPSRGLRLALSGEKSIPDIGADRDYWRASLSGRFAQPLGGRTALELELFGGLSGDDLPVYEQFRIGGPVLAPGLYEEELWGPQAAAGALTARFEPLHNLKLLVRLGAGGVWQKLGEFRPSDLNPGLGLGAIYMTPAGPVSGEWGIQSDGASRFTFTLGYRGP